MSLSKKSIYALFISFSISITGCSSIVVSEATPKIKTGKDINFFIATDIHYLSKDLTDGKDAFQLWQTASSSFSQRYVNSIIDDKDADDNKLHITKASK